MQKIERIGCKPNKRRSRRDSLDHLFDQGSQVVHKYVGNSMIQNNSIKNNVFWGLKDNWWKQMYDGRYHKFGSEVFDKGLHDESKVEPGFYNSIKNASEYAAEQIGQPLTIGCYKRIHQLACAHFPHVKRNQINVDKENIDKFRNTDCSFLRNLVKHPYEYENEEQSIKRKLGFVLLHRVRLNVLLKDEIKTVSGCKKELDELLPLQSKERIVNQYTKTDFTSKGIDIRDLLEKGNPIYEQAIESKGKVVEQLEVTQKKLNLAQPFASLKIDASHEETLVRINYNYQNPTEIEETIHKLINDYNEKIQKFPSNPVERSPEENELALKYIAELFQNLEWLHPFFDGQGRTDLVLLAKLLTENGFNPSILYNPYYSTFEPLEKWISYLKKGMEAWKREKENI